MTQWNRWAARLGWPSIGLGLAIVLSALPLEARADARVIDAQVIWTSDDRIYLAARDSSLFETGMTFRFRRDGETVATAMATAIHNREIAIATRIMGTLDCTDCGELEILAEWPAATSLRIGYPSAKRDPLLVECAGVTIAALYPPSVYRHDGADPKGSRLIRIASSIRPSRGPDTLFVRYFDEAADQEIALERGEIDCAVFWPGELSQRMRNAERWPKAFATRARGVIAAIHSNPGAETAGRLGIAMDDLSPLNELMFKGDLRDWHAQESLERSQTMVTPGSTVIRPDSPNEHDEALGTVFEVAPHLRGAEAARRLLADQRPATPASSDTVRIVYLDATATSPLSLLDAVIRNLASSDGASRARARADTLSRWAQQAASEGRRVSLRSVDERLREFGVLLAYRSSAVVVHSLEATGRVERIGVDAAADLLRCASGGRP